MAEMQAELSVRNVYLVLVAMPVVASLLYAVFLLRTRDVGWLLHPHRRYRSDNVIMVAAASFWSLAGVSVCVGIALLVLRPFSAHAEKLLLSPGFLYYPLALVFAVFTFLNTLILRRVEEERIGSFADLLVALTDELRRINESQQHREEEFFYMVDYTPAVGSISLRGVQGQETVQPILYRNYETLLKTVSDTEARVEIVCLTATGVAQFHRDLRAPDQLNQSVEDLIRNIEQITTADSHTPGTGLDAVWRTTNIGPSHIVVTPRVAFQYVVVPELNGARNRVFGLRTEDKFLIEFLRRTFEDYVRRSITPAPVIDGGAVRLRFEPQCGIAKVRVFLSQTETFSPDPTKPYHEFCWPTATDDLPTLTLCADVIGLNRYLKVVLVKINGATSLPSHCVRIPVNSESEVT